MRRLFVVVAVVGLSFAALGCETNKGKSVAPVAPATAYSIPGAHLEVVERDGEKVLAWVEDVKGRLQLARILYYCDFPMGYYGPPSPGHCYEDGSGCTGPPIGPDPRDTAAPSPGGDPDATGNNASADGDGIVLKSAAGPLKGDPTADD